MQIMACRLVAPSHYLNQCWNIVSSNVRNKSQWKPVYSTICGVTTFRFNIEITCNTCGVWPYTSLEQLCWNVSSLEFWYIVQRENRNVNSRMPSPWSIYFLMSWLITFVSEVKSMILCAGHAFLKFATAVFYFSNRQPDRLLNSRLDKLNSNGWGNVSKQNN